MINPHDESVETYVNMLRQLARDSGHRTSLDVFLTMSNIVSPEAQEAIYANLLAVPGSGPVKVRLESIGDKKIFQIKHLRGVTGWTLREAKDFVEAVQGKGPNAGPEIFQVESLEAARQYVDDVRCHGGFACII